MPTIRALYKKDYSAAEKLFLAWSLMRKLFSYHLQMTSRPPYFVKLMLCMRLIDAAVLPIRFHWALAENLGMLVLNCFLPTGLSLLWILLCHVLGLLINVVQEVRYRKQYLALEKSHPCRPLSARVRPQGPPGGSALSLSAPD
eukprot:gene19510-26181_t